MCICSARGFDNNYALQYTYYIHICTCDQWSMVAGGIALHVVLLFMHQGIFHELYVITEPYLFFFPMFIVWVKKKTYD